MATIVEAMNLALEHHRARRLEQAEEIYRRVLVVEPAHFPAIRLLSMALVQSGRYSDSQNYLQQWRTSQPQDAQALYYSGVAAHGLGELEPAFLFLQQAVSLQPTFVEALMQLGCVLSDLHRYTEAANFYQRVVTLQPNDAKAYLHLGEALLELQQFESAISALHFVLKIHPQLPEAHYLLGQAYQILQRTPAAIAAYDKAIELRPDYGLAWNRRGTIAAAQKDYIQASVCFQMALQAEPTNEDYYFNFIQVMRSLDSLEAAAECFRKVIQIRPNDGQSYNNLGTIQYSLGRFAEAAQCYRKSIELNPELAIGHINHAYSLLQQGDFHQGWPEYEWRWHMEEMQEHRPNFKQPQWNGSSLAGKTLLVIAEQGLGDTLQFIRYLSLLKPSKLIFACQPQLISLLKNYPGVDELVVEGETPPPFDEYIPLLSIPGVMQTRLTTIPREVPYLSIPSEWIAAWRIRLQPYTGWKVGINWRGRPGVGEWRNRDLELWQLATIAQIPGVHLICLQFGELTTEEQEAAKQCGLICFENLDQEHGRFTDTAAIMKNLDLVISSDTSIPHLAGALGVPVWVALPLASDWRWLIEREDSPWYPTMRLFRQSQRGIWSDVIQPIASLLQSIIKTSLSH